MRERHVTIVYGPPAAGKTTYVEQHREPGDLVWDFDAVYSTITGLPAHFRRNCPHPLVMALRDAFIRFLIGHRDTTNVWIIESLPTRVERLRRFQQLGCSFVEIVPDIHECRRRMSQRAPECADAIDQWFARYEPEPESPCHS